MPFGAALGFILGGVIGQYLGWQYAFLLCGAPGLIVMFLICIIKDPGVGIYDPDMGTKASFCQDLWDLMRNVNFVFIVIGNVFLNFGLGALADWLPTFMYRTYNETSLATSGLIVGVVTVVCGIGGSILGSFLGDYTKEFTRQSYFMVSGFGVIIASIFSGLCFILTPSMWIFVIFLFLAEMALWFPAGLIMTHVANSTGLTVRARAFGLVIFFNHILGDAIAPSIIGYISDKTSLWLAVSSIPLIFLIGGITWIIAWRCAEEPPTIKKQAISDIMDSYSSLNNPSES